MEKRIINTTPNVKIEKRSNYPPEPKMSDPYPHKYIAPKPKPLPQPDALLYSSSINIHDIMQQGFIHGAHELFIGDIKYEIMTKDDTSYIIPHKRGNKVDRNEIVYTIEFDLKDKSNEVQSFFQSLVGKSKPVKFCQKHIECSFGLGDNGSYAMMFSHTC